MAERYNQKIQREQVRREGVVADRGLRAHMLKVYNYMASGVMLTGIISLLTYTTPALANLLYVMSPSGVPMGYTGLGYVALLSPLAIVFGMSFGAHKMKASTLQILFWTFATLMGLSLSSIFFVYTGFSVAKIFFITAVAFGSLSLWGYTTKKDISGWGAFLFMGLIGIIIAMIVNIFLGSAMMDFIISIIGVLIFAGLTAYDTQKIKNMYNVNDNDAIASKKAIMGALKLYLDFINMMLFMLRLFGARR
ncbi:MAG: Bax inhibitor-1/YccA family protein [Proteobacteria bacterium]|nr:Bax inhibitor-1/YccA family protein [Pseudomonadota bacterium]